MLQNNPECVIIEDDLNWKIKLQVILDEIGVSVIGTASSISEATTILQKVKPCFVIADILLGDEKIFSLFEKNEKFSEIPTIFLTVSDKEIDYKKAQIVKKLFFLVKPIHKLTLKAAIDNICDLKRYDSVEKEKSLIIKGRYNENIHIGLDKIIYLFQEKHYSTIITISKSFRLKKSMRKLLELLDNRFIQVHRSYCVNKNFINNFGVGLKNVKLKNSSISIPIGPTYVDSIKELISIKNSDFN